MSSTSANEVIGGFNQALIYVTGIPDGSQSQQYGPSSTLPNPAILPTRGLRVECKWSAEPRHKEIAGLSFFNYNQSAGWLNRSNLGGSSNYLEFQIAENNGLGGIITFSCYACRNH